MVIETKGQVPEPIRMITLKSGEVFHHTTRDEDGTLVEGYYMATSRTGFHSNTRLCVNLKTGVSCEFDFQAIIEPVNAKLVVSN